ncbi:MAG: serine protease, partial [Gemmatimonadota bacterium]|nr:serine protease [Gemmatimonadota bacterium]
MALLRQPRRAILLVAAVLLLLAGFGAAQPVQAQAPPPPHAFYGSAMLDGAPAPDGATITATSESGAVVGSTEISGGGWTINVDPADARSVTFRINGSNPSGAYSVVSSAITEVRLNLTSVGSSTAPDASPADPPPEAGEEDPPAEEQPVDCDFVDGVARVTAATAQVVMREGTGTAFYVGNDEWVTAAHVVEAGGSIRLRTDTWERAATLMGRDVAADLAVLRASGTGLTALTFGDDASLRLGETLGVAGYPMGLEGSPSVASGLLSRFVSADGIAYIQTSAEISPGNSGGPLFTACGDVVGVVVLKAVDEAVEGLAWAVTLPTLDDRLPRLRGDRNVTPRGEAALTITAICNRQWDGERWQRPSNSAACRAAAEGGLHTGEGWRWIAAVRGVEDWANVAYRFDGGPSFGRGERWSAFDALAPGLHTIEARELRNGVWTAWSVPYAFTIRGAQHVAPLTIVAICNQQWNAASGTWEKHETFEACLTSGAEGLRTGEGWFWAGWIEGIADRGNPMEHRFDGGAALDWSSDDVFDTLAPGRHTIEVREQRGGVWTQWSVPYTFTIITPPGSLQITAFCNWSDRATFAACQAGAAGGLDPEQRWYIWARGVTDWANVYYSIDGGVGTLRSDTSLAGLAPGPHTVHIRELRDGIWTDWSAPFTFTIRAPIRLTILALCNWTDRSTLATCRAGAAEGLDPEAGWYIWASGFEDWGNVYLSVNGGSPPLASGNFTLRGLPTGRYTLQMNERRATGWVGWSLPYTFTIRASDTDIVVSWLREIYDDAVALYDEYSAIERNTPGVYTYRRAGQLHDSLSVRARAWG